MVIPFALGFQCLFNMPFKKGHKLAIGGARRGAGRKSKQSLEVKKEAAIVAREYIEENLKPILETYLGLAAGTVVKKYDDEGKEVELELHVDPPTTRHAVDKIFPTDHAVQAQTINVAFIGYNQHPAQLHSKELSAPVLAIDDDRNKEVGESVASQEREGQVGPKFHNF